MRRLLPLAALVALGLPAGLAAQAPELRIAAGGAPATFAAALHRGYPAYPASALRSLGAEVASEPRGARVVLFGDTLVFDARSPFFLDGARVQQLVAPVYLEGGIVYLPHQFFAEWLPARYPRRLQLREGVLRVEPAAVAANGQGSAGGTKAAPATGAGAGKTTPSAAPAPAAPAGNGAGKAAAPSRAPEKEKRVVIIDPGHGGKDPGKVGPNGIREKDVVLKVATSLAAILRERGGYEVHLTRSRDTLIALADRPRLANRWKAGRPAALFLSIHANAGPSAARGFETFFLSEARTEDERRVAEMENAAIEYEDERPSAGLDDRDWILNNLRNDFYLRASNDLAEVIQGRLQGFHPGPNRGVKQAGFRVLVGAFMPAVLVELAFISNREEAKLLGDAAFQRRVAGALADAVDRFFASHEHLLTAEGAR